MTERRLATVRRIDAITPIENSDFLELLTVDGWNAVVPKSDHHSVGDLVVYCETDSFLPIWPEFHFLEKGCLRKLMTAEGNRTGYRLRTIKLRGQISEGLVIPLNKIDSDIEGTTPTWFLDIKSQNIVHPVEEGDEVTEILNIIKWEIPLHASLAGNALGFFPSFLRKTDSERIENFIKDYVRKYRSHYWEVTTKLDGSSFTAYYKDGEFGVCSRNLDLAESDGNSFWIAARKNGLPTKMKEYSELSPDLKNFAIQGELMGPGVQGNREGFSDLDIFVFDIYDIDNHTKIDAKTRHGITTAMGLNHVPYHGIIKLDDIQTAKGFLDMAEGPSINNPVREGLVFKSVDDPNVNFKAISNSFKLAQKD